MEILGKSLKKFVVQVELVQQVTFVLLKSFFPYSIILRIQESRCREKTLLASKVTRKEDRICPFYHVPFFASLDSVKGYYF